MSHAIKAPLPPRPAKRSGRGLLQWLHLWLGLILCLPLVLLGLTGSILVFQQEIDQATDPAFHHAGVGSTQTITAMIAAAQKAAPKNQQASFFTPPQTRGDSAIVRFAAGRQAGPGFGAQVAVDPASLNILGVRDGNGFMRQVHMLHGNLLISGRDGRSIIGWLGVVMLAMGLSGLYLWWPRPGRWRAAFGVGRGARGVRLHRELHGAVGIWGLLVFLVVSFSGVYLAFPETVGSAVGVVLPGAEIRPAQPPKVSPVEGQTPIDADRAAALATAAVPGAALRGVALPMRPDQPYRVSLANADAAEGAPAITVFVDPWTASVAEIRDPAAYAAGSKLMAWQRAIHAGAGLGPIWSILVALSGLLPALFAVTGVSMWLLKRRARRNITARTASTLAAAE